MDLVVQILSKIKICTTDFSCIFEKDDYNYLPQNTNDFKTVGM